jgi:hypothetical protein
MMTLLRRFLVLAGLMFWQGGFTFYASVVVPVAQAELGHTRQGFITRQVTDYLNLSGAAVLLLLAWDTAATADRSAMRRRLRWVSWLGMAVTLALLFWLHGQMNDLVDLKQREILDRLAFRQQHRGYLWISSVQWSFALAFIVLTLRTWREEDRNRG